jgi:hypothetical protein
MRPKPIYILTLLFLGLTVYIILIHLKKIEYFVNTETNKTGIDLYKNDFKIAMQLDNQDRQFLRVNLFFTNLTNDLLIRDISLKMDGIKLEKIKTFQNMQPFEPLSFNSFIAIPDSLRLISKELIGSYEFEHYFEKSAIQKNQPIEIQLVVEEKGIQKRIYKKVLINKIERIEFIIEHGETTALLIPLFGLISLIFISIIIVKSISRKRKNSA